MLLKALPAQGLEKSLSGGSAPEEGAEAPEREPGIASGTKEPADLRGDTDASLNLKDCTEAEQPALSAKTCEGDDERGAFLKRPSHSLSEMVASQGALLLLD